VVGIFLFREFGEWSLINMQIVFWQNMLSYHQSAYIRALSNKKNIRVMLIVQEDIPEWRKGMGWNVPDFGNAKILICPEKAKIFQILKETNHDSVHIFSGIRAYPLVRNAFLQSLSTGASVGIISESADVRGIKGMVRLGLGKIEAVRFHNKIDFILAMGDLGVQWFKKCGFPTNKIYPFGYFVEKNELNKSNFKQHNKYINNKFRLLFIGQLIKRKGIDILLRALSGLKESNWFLDIIGDGKERRNIGDLCEILNLAKYVKFHGIKNNIETIELLKTADLLVLPSHFDGWGAVVNEALMCGVPVVCSDACGAADLIKDSFRGEIFKTGSISDLRRILAYQILQGKKTPELSSKIKIWSKKIEGENAANYLLEVIDSSLNKKQKPNQPWF
jgi:glycosyltransferase involved in cell wall biosynthesis